jgi:hypothetical protein
VWRIRELPPRMWTVYLAKSSPRRTSGVSHQTITPLARLQRPRMMVVDTGGASPPPLVVVPVRQVVLPEQVLAVVIPVGRTHDDVNMLARGLFRVGGDAC